MFCVAALATSDQFHGLSAFPRPRKSTLQNYEKYKKRRKFTENYEEFIENRPFNIMRKRKSTLQRNVFFAFLTTKSAVHFLLINLLTHYLNEYSSIYISISFTISNCRVCCTIWLCR